MRLLVFSCLLLTFATAALASTEFDVLLGAQAKPSIIVAGPAGNLWVIENGRGAIA